MSQPQLFQDKVSLAWSVSAILSGKIKPREKGQTILLLIAWRRLERALEKTRNKVIKRAKSLPCKFSSPSFNLNKESSQYFNFYNSFQLALGIAE